MSTFIARYRGRCVGCDEGIEPGDLLTYDEDDGIIHADCTSSAKAVKPRRTEICPSCFMEKSVDGTCGCP